MVQQTKDFVQQKNQQLRRACSAIAREYDPQPSIARVHLQPFLETLRKDPYAEIETLKSALRARLFREYLRKKKYEEWFQHCKTRNCTQDTYIRGLAVIQSNPLLSVQTIKKRLQRQLAQRTPQIHPVGKESRNLKTLLDDIFSEHE